MGGVSQPNIGVGINQTWQNVTASRARSTSYQNTTGRPILVAIYATVGGPNFSVSEDNVTFVGTGYAYTNIGGNTAFMCAVVPPNFFYKDEGSGAFYWAELR